MDFKALSLDASPDEIIVTTLTGEVPHWSRGAEIVFGYTAAEAMGRSVADLILLQGVSDGVRTVEEPLTTGANAYEGVRRRKDGSVLYVGVSYKRVHEDAGQAGYLLYSKQDITHLKALRDSKLVEARFSDLLESMPDGVVMVNASGRIVLATSQAETLFGYGPGELRGKPIEALLPGHLHDAHIRHRSAFMAQPRVRSVGVGRELFGLRKDGTEVPVEISLSLLETEEGTLVSSAIRDITDRKHAERALQEKNFELANANLEKDQFLASMRHELRTHLNAISGFTGTMLMKLPGPLTAEHEKQLHTVQTSARHLLRLINDVLDLSKVGVGKMKLFPEAFLLSKVVEDVCAVIAPLAKAKSIAITRTLDPDAEHVTLDLQKFRQMLLNLLTRRWRSASAISVPVRRSG